MKLTIVIAGLAAAATLPLVTAPTTAHASCEDRKMAGTVIGGVGGALIGGSIARGGGALVGGLGGAVVGHQIAGSGCRRYSSRGEYRRREGPWRRDYGNGYARGAEYPYAPPAYAAAQPVYYDQYGDTLPVAAAYAGQRACPTRMQSYYDSRGVVVQRPVQDCAR